VEIASTSETKWPASAIASTTQSSRTVSMAGARSVARDGEEAECSYFLSHLAPASRLDAGAIRFYYR
jgi:hypothetical protein